jgi:hypothetical protein
MDTFNPEDEYLISLEDYDYIHDMEEDWYNDCKNASYSDDETDDFSDVKPHQIYMCSDTSMDSSSDDSSDDSSDSEMSTSPLDTSRFQHCFLRMGDEMEL